jgi:L-amino acid N-acyltransferase YncA
MPYTHESMTDEHRKPGIDIFNHFFEHSLAAYPEEPMDYIRFNRFPDMVKGYPSVFKKTESGETIGFAFLRLFLPVGTFKRTAEINNFLLAERARRELGTTLLNRFAEEARRMGADNLLASISSRNLSSLDFHRKHGFIECGQFLGADRKFGFY